MHYYILDLIWVKFLMPFMLVIISDIIIFALFVDNCTAKAGLCTIYQLFSLSIVSHFDALKRLKA